MLSAALDDLPGEVVDCASPNLRDSYIAYRAPTEGGGDVVVCLVARLQWHKHYRDMDYTISIEGSSFHSPAKCPARILALLDPPEVIHAPGQARVVERWRARCTAHLERMKALPRVRRGDTIVFERPVRISGARITHLKFLYGSTFEQPGATRLLMIHRWREREWRIERDETSGACAAPAPESALADLLRESGFAA